MSGRFSVPPSQLLCRLVCASPPPPFPSPFPPSCERHAPKSVRTLKIPCGDDDDDDDDDADDADDADYVDADADDG